MTWTALQYKRAWDELYAKCDLDAQATADQRLETLRQRGNLCRRPITANLRDGIFELRAKDARFLFYFGSLGRTVVFVHGLIKKQGNVPPRDIEQARYNRALAEAQEAKLDVV